MSDVPREPGAETPGAPGSGPGSQAGDAGTWPSRPGHVPARTPAPEPVSPHLPRERLAADDPRVTGEMSFLEHLDQLRVVLMQAAAAAAVGAIGGWFLSPIALSDLIHRTVGRAVVLSPLEAFNERFKLALLIGAMITAPFIFYRVWSFVVPGLLKRERSLIFPLAMTSLVLFAAGLAASYFYVVPMIVHVLSGFLVEGMEAQIRVTDLLGFFYNVSLACGVVAQLPIVTMALTAIGLVTPMTLLRQWRYALVGAFITTAAITPGDVITAQLILGLPMAALYFVSVGLSWFVAKRRRDTPATEEP